MTSFSEFLSSNRVIFNFLFHEIMSKSESTPLSHPFKKLEQDEVEKWRIAGKLALDEEKFKEALKSLSKSISIASERSPVLASAFCNRSTALLALEKYELALLDMNRALKREWNENLLKTRKDCWDEVQNQKKLKLKITQAIHSAGSELNSIERKILFINDQLSIDASDLNIEFDYLEDPIWNTKFDNQFLPNVSSKVRLETSAEWGRHWIATENIAPGEVLSIEKVLVLTSPETRSLFECCDHCTVRCEALIPCLTCSAQMYCSERCRREAYDLYHRVECKVGLLADNDSWKSGACMALRVFLIGTNQGESLNELITNPEVYARIEGRWNCVNTPYPDNYLFMLNLNWRINYEETFEDDRSRKSFTTTALLFNALNRIGFFGTWRIHKTFQDFNEVELFTGFLLFHNLSLLHQHCGQIHVSSYGFGLEPSRSSDNVGLGIALFEGLMNHSCNPNTFTVLNRRRLLSYTLRPIKAGEQIFTSYGRTYLSNDKKARAPIFNHFKMECRCRACNENWPTLSVLRETEDVFLTSDEEIIEEIKKQFVWVIKFSNSVMQTTICDIRDLSKDNLEKALDFRSSLVHVKEPSRLIGSCQKLIQAFIMQSAGNLYITPPLGKILIKYDEFIKKNKKNIRSKISE